MVTLTGITHDSEYQLTLNLFGDRERTRNLEKKRQTKSSGGMEIQRFYAHHHFSTQGRHLNEAPKLEDITNEQEIRKKMGCGNPVA